MTAPAQQLDISITTCIRSALASGALQPIATEQQTIEDHGIPFVVRWVSGLARKRLKTVTDSGRRPDYNPFLPHDPALEVRALGPAHVALLNKFPVMERHLLVITREYVAQTAPLTGSDFAALWSIIAQLGGMGFCNGGHDAGASQHHKHLQWVPARPEDATSVPIAAALATADPRTTLNAVPALPFAHAFCRLDDCLQSAEQDAGIQLHVCFTRLCKNLGIDSEYNPLPPYNLLLTRRWMLVVRRSRESWQHMSVNSLGYAGLLFVPERSQLAAVREAGPLNILKAVTAGR